jgi:hypothetical protein
MILDYDNESTGSLSAMIGFLVLKKALQAKGSKRRLAPVSFAHVVQTHDVNHFKADFGFDVTEFNAIHAALALPHVVKTAVLLGNIPLQCVSSLVHQLVF